MRDKFDPFEDCLANLEPGGACTRREAWDSPQILWITEAVQLIIGLAYTYNTIRNNGEDVDRLLVEIGSQLDDLRNRLTQVNKNIERVIDLILDLPRIVRGEVEAAVLKAELGKADQIVSIIQDLIRPKFILQNQSRLQAHLDNLQIQIGAISGLRGASGVLIAAPYIATWLAGSVGLEKAKRQANPSSLIDSPWNRKFMKDMLSTFTDLMNQVEMQDRVFDTNTIPGFPPHSIALEVQNGKLTLPPSTRTGTYRIACPNGLSSERLQALNIMLPTPQWIDVPSNSPVHQAARSAFQAFQAERGEVIAFYSLLPKLYKQKTALLDVFIEPAGYWDSNA